MVENVLFLSPWYPHNDDPMFGLFVRKQALSLSEKIKCGVVAVFPTGSEDGYVIQEDMFDGKLPEIRVFFKASKNPIINILNFRKAFVLGVQKYTENYGSPHLIHANIFTRTAVIACGLAKKLNIPFVVSEHWSRYIPENYKYTGFLRKCYTKRVAKKAKAVIVPSEFLMNSMKKVGIKANYKIVPNVIDEKLFDIAASKPDFSAKKIVHISCFEDKSKNISGLLQAALLLKEKRSDFKLHLVGTGMDIEFIRKKAMNLGIDSFVVFHGMLENENLAEVLKSATFSVLSSNYETFAIVVFESLACGVPVVSTDVAGLGKIITPEMGITVPAGNIEALARALETMLENHSVYVPQKLREFILGSYTADKVAGQLIDVYNNKQII